MYKHKSNRIQQVKDNQTPIHVYYRFQMCRLLALDVPPHKLNAANETHEVMQCFAVRACVVNSF